MGFFSNLFGGGGSNSKLEEIINKGCVLIDVRTKKEFKEGHVNGAINIPLQQIPKQARKLKAKKKPIVVYCRSGARAGSAMDYLKNAGVEVYNGGGWVSLRKIVAKVKNG